MFLPNPIGFQKVIFHFIADTKMVVGPTTKEHFVFGGKPDY